MLQYFIYYISIIFCNSLAIIENLFIFAVNFFRVENALLPECNSF